MSTTFLHGNSLIFWAGQIRPVGRLAGVVYTTYSTMTCHLRFSVIQIYCLIQVQNSWPAGESCLAGTVEPCREQLQLRHHRFFRERRKRARGKRRLLIFPPFAAGYYRVTEESILDYYWSEQFRRESPSEMEFLSRRALFAIYIFSSFATPIHVSWARCNRLWARTARLTTKVFHELVTFHHASSRGRTDGR